MFITSIETSIVKLHGDHITYGCPAVIFFRVEKESNGNDKTEASYTSSQELDDLLLVFYVFHRLLIIIQIYLLADFDQVIVFEERIVFGLLWVEGINPFLVNVWLSQSVVLVGGQSLIFVINVKRNKELIFLRLELFVVLVVGKDLHKAVF